MHQQKNFMTIWTMWLLASFFYAYQYVLRVLPNIMMVDIFEKFHIDANIFGQYSGFYYIGYAGMHIPVGILLDKYGPKKILPFCMLLATIGLAPLLFCDHWIYPSIGRILIGMGSSAAILGVFKIIRMAFSEEKFTLMLGFSVTIGLIGAIYGGQPVNYLFHTFGSDAVIKIVIGIGILLAMATFWIIPKQTETHSDKSWWASVKEVFTHPQVIVICLLAGCMVGPLEGFADVWGKEYLKSVYKLSENAAASLPSLIFLGMCIGSPILSWFVAKTKAYFATIIVSAFVMGVAFLLLLSGQLPTQTLSILFITVGIFCAYQILALHLTSTYVSERLVGLTTACANMIIMIFGYVFHSLIGKIMTVQWSGEMQNGIPIYNAADYTQGLMVIPVGLIMAGLGYIWMVMAKKPKKAMVQKSSGV
ncbi:MAG: MFS transporter [Candidatus Berkiellales bacterium]